MTAHRTKVGVLGVGIVLGAAMLGGFFTPRDVSYDLLMRQAEVDIDAHSGTRLGDYLATHDARLSSFIEDIPKSGNSTDSISDKVLYLESLVDYVSVLEPTLSGGTSLDPVYIDRSSEAWLLNQSELASRQKAVRAFAARELLHIVEEYGWPTVPVYGELVSTAAWRIAEMAHEETELQVELLAAMAAHVGRGTVIGTQFARLQDRVLASQEGTQLYGTLGRCITEGKWVPLPLSSSSNDLSYMRSLAGLRHFSEDKANYDRWCMENYWNTEELIPPPGEMTPDDPCDDYQAVLRYEPDDDAKLGVRHWSQFGPSTGWLFGTVRARTVRTLFKQECK